MSRFKTIKEATEAHNWNSLGIKYRREIMQKTLMEMLIEAGYPKEEMDHHCSDLYLYVTSLTTKVIEEWCKAHDYRMAWHCPTFRDQITGKMMYDCAFQWYEN